MCMCAKLLQSCLTFCEPMDLPCQAPLSMGFSRQEYWSGLLCLLQGIFRKQGSNPSLMSPALASRFFTTSTTHRSLLISCNV